MVLVVKNLPANPGDRGSIPGLRRSPGGGNGNLLQCSCLENPMDRGAWRARVHRVTKNQTQLTLACTKTARSKQCGFAFPTCHHQYSDTNWMSYNSAHFWDHQIPISWGLNPKTTLYFSSQCKSRLSPVLLIVWLHIRESHYILFVLSSFARGAQRTQEIRLLTQFSSVAQSYPTLCDPMNRSMPGLPVHHQLPEFTH